MIVWLFACLDPEAPLGEGEPVVIEVPAGATARGLEDDLVAAGVPLTGWRWALFLRGTDASCVKAGRHEVSPTMSMQGVLDALCGAPIPDEVAFTVIEGWRIRDIDAALAEAGLDEAGRYTQLATTREGIAVPFEVPGTSLEGYLYPETYRIPKRGAADELIERQLETFGERFLRPPPTSGRSMHDLVTMASLLEREEPDPANRPLVAGILFKRLDAGSPLGVDATSRYTLAAWNDRKAFLGKLRDPDDPYNTRLRKGLPPTPIGNPTVASLAAAVSPVPSEFWYYLHDAQGKLHPARDAAGHEANRRAYDVW